MTIQSTWRQMCVGAKLALGAAVVAGVMAFSAPGHAVTITGTLAGAEDGDPVVDLLTTPHDFGSQFANADSAGIFTFNFENTTASTILISLVNATINQSTSLFFTSGVTTTFDGLIRITAQGVTDAFSLATLVNPGETIQLVFNFGDPVGSTNGAGPDIDFNIEATVIPLPAGLVLFLSGLVGIGFLGRYKAKRREPAIA